MLAAVVGALVAAVWSPTAASAAPANDNFANAQDLGSALPATTAGSNVGATSELGEPRVSEGADHSIWFRWQATESGAVTIETCGSQPSTAIGVFKGGSLGQLTEIAIGGEQGGLEPFCDRSRLVFYAVAGSSYAIAVDGVEFGGSPEGAIALRLSRTAPPANDSIGNAAALPFDEMQHPGDNRGATADPADQGGGGSVWYSVTASRDGGMAIYACNGSFKPEVAVYAESGVGTLTALGRIETTPACEFAFFGAAGVTYLVEVYGPPGPEPGSISMGQFTIGARNEPKNDDFARASNLPANVGFSNFVNFLSTAGATKEPGEPNHAGNSGGASVWFEFASPLTGSMRFGVCNNSFHALLGAYIGDSVAALKPVASLDHPGSGGCNPNGPGVLAFNIDAGTTYRIALDGAGGAAGGYSLGYAVSTDRIPMPDLAPAQHLAKRPKTRLTRRKIEARRGRAVFVLGSDQPGSRFRCQLDKRKAHMCKARIVFDHLRPGRHVFRASAIDAAGADPSPVVVRFRVHK